MAEIDTPTLKSHMVIPSCREIRFVVCFAGDSASGELAPFDLPGTISYDLFRHEPYGPKEAAQVFARNHASILAAATLAFRRAQREAPNSLVLSLQAADMSGTRLE